MVYHFNIVYMSWCEIFLGIITYFCPCYIIGKNAEAVGDSCCLCGLAHFVQGINLYTRTHIRGKIREQKGIPVSYDPLFLSPLPPPPS